LFKENTMKKLSIGGVLAVLMLICGGAFLGGSVALAQGITSGTLSGTVADATGAVIAGAKITATNPDTNAVYLATTGSSGSFSLSDLPVGIYVVKIEDQGFSNLALNDVHVDSNHTVDLGIQKLQPGGSSITIEVTTAQGLLETTEAQISTTFDTEQVANLPLGGGFDEMTLLVPGIVATHDNNFSNTNGTGFSSNGQRGRSNNFEIDGQSNNDNSVGGPQFFFGNEEAISQVEVISNNFSAAYGRNMGSVVNYITKSGTNQIHGSAFYKYSGDFTSSLATGSSKGPQFGFCAPGENPSDGCTPPVVPRFVYNEFGGNGTAPIWRDKLFASGSFYGTRFFGAGSTTSSGTSMFPTAAGLATLGSTYTSNPAIAILNQLNPFNLQGNPHATGSPVNKTVTDGTTAVTIPFTQIGRSFPSSTLDKEYFGKLDYQATAKDRFSLRYIYQNNPTIPDNPTAAGGTVNVSGITHSIGADWVRSFSSQWVNALRYSFQQSKIAFEGGDFPGCTITTTQNCPSSISLGAGFTALGLGGSYPQGRIVKVGQVQDNATWSLGRHSITFGGEFDYQNSPNVFLPNQAGSFSFSSFSNFLQGIGTLNVTQGTTTVPFREKDVAVYFQDDWKVTPEFTANIGLRWEFFQQAINLLHDESVAQQTGSHPYWLTSLPLSLTTFPTIPQSYRDFEPRIGFAYSPNYVKNMVVRGGFAISVDPAFYNMNLNAATSAPIVNAGSIACTGTATASAPAKCLPTGGANYVTVTSAFGSYIPTGVNPGTRNETLVGANFRQPFAETYTLGIQYQLGRAAVAEVRYSGNHTSGNFQSLDGNPYLLPVSTDFPSVVAPNSLCTSATSTLTGGADIGHLHCGSTNQRIRANTAFSNYNALQTSLTTKEFHGVTGTAAYTFSRTIDNTSEIFGTLSGGNSIAFAQNPLDTNVGERGVSGISFPNVASVSLVYAVPKFVSSDSLVGRVVNGWQLNTIWLYNSGQPYTDFDYYQNQSPNINGSDSNTYTSYSDSKEASAFNSGYDFARPLLSNPKAPVGAIGIYTTTGSGSTLSAPFLVDYSTGLATTASQVHWISNNKYAAKLAGRPFPGSGRNLLRGNTFNNVDASVFKNTKLTERVTLRIEADAYNVLNRSYYGTPDNFIGDAPGGSFNNFFYNSAGGGFVGAGTGVRNMTFGGKILF
jgi:hypothetical protein